MHTRPTDDDSRDDDHYDFLDNVGTFDDLYFALIDAAVEHYNHTWGDHDYSGS